MINKNQPALKYKLVSLQLIIMIKTIVGWQTKFLLDPVESRVDNLIHIEIAIKAKTTAENNLIFMCSS